MEAERERKYVLIVDDNPDERMTAAALIEQAGLEPLFIVDFPDAMNSLAKGDGEITVTHMMRFRKAPVLVKEVVGILSDFLFDPRCENNGGTTSRWMVASARGVSEHQAPNTSAPGGLCAILLGRLLSLPVVICTSCGLEGHWHHDANYGWFHDGFLVPLRRDMTEEQRRSLGIGWVKEKNWPEALRELLEMARISEPVINQS